VTELSGRARWFSARALRLHGALLCWDAGCAAAAIWQVGRALQGNALSYLYSFEWPFFGVLGIVGWWMLLHSEPTGATDSTTAPVGAAVFAPPPMVVTPTTDEAVDDDPVLAAYNAHLAQLAVRPRKRLWGH
jgi:hypothetical protein